MKKDYNVNVNKERKWLWEFSKRLMVGVSICTVLITVFILYMIYSTGDMNYISTLMETTSDVFKVAVIGYLVKAGAENVVKVSHSNNNEDTNTDYNNNSEIDTIEEDIDNLSEINTEE